MPTPLPIEGRPLRLGVVGLGQIAELMLPSYRDRADVEIVGLCDRSTGALARWAGRLPGAAAVTDVGALLELQPDVVDVYVPTPYHAEVVVPLLEAGVHVQCQKPIARTVEDCDRMLAAARATGAVLRILEDYLFYEPLVKLRDVVASGEIGDPTGVHMNIVGTGRGGWDVDMRSYIWQFEQAKDGRGMLVFDHGWHQLAVAHSMFGPVRRIYAWIGATQPAPELAPEVLLDAPSTLVWEHHNGVRGVMDVTLSPDQYFRSDYYTCDERVEVTGSRGYARCNRISAYGIQEPSVVVYAEGEMRGYHALADTPPDAFRASTAHALDVFLKGATPVVMSGEAARDVLAALEAAIVSAREGHAVDVAN
jgi:predicted dehydrogenase